MLGKLSDLWWALRARFEGKYWMIDTKMPRYQYHECDERMLYGMFSVLEDFVEIELAHFEGICVDQPLVSKQFGIDHLVRCSKSINDEESLWTGATKEDVLEIYQDRAYLPSQGAEYAKEALELYQWWKGREFRPELTIKNVDNWDLYYKEDTDMLVRLCKIRGYLWT